MTANINDRLFSLYIGLMQYISVIVDGHICTLRKLVGLPLPVLITPGCPFTHGGSIMPSIMAMPRIMRFRGTRMSIKWTLDSATVMTMPKPTTMSAPMTGSGMMVRTAPTLPKSPHTIKRTPSTCHVNRAAIYKRHRCVEC